jgi:hypothetical protein
MIARNEDIERPESREPGRYYIDELSGIVNRKPDTIRKWERSDMLPVHLKPKRGTRDWRYWTDSQVFGPRGILHWMRSNDIRPGAYLTTPEGEANHIRHMRRPRGMKISMLEEIRYWARTFKTGTKKGIHRRSRKWIVDHYFDQTSYSSKPNFEKALVNYFSAQGWEFPPPARSARTTRRASSRMTKKDIAKHPEVRRATREANRIVRLVDKKLKTTKGK